MTSADALKTWLTTRTADQLTALLEQRELPYAGGPGLDDPARLAEHLLTDSSVHRSLQTIDTGDFQVLVAVAVLADRLHGPAPTPSGRPGPAGFSGFQPATRPSPFPVPRPDPAERAVPRSLLLAEFGRPNADGTTATFDATLQDTLEAALDRLADRALVLPPHGKRLAVPMLLHQQVAELEGLGRPVAILLNDAYRAAEVHRIAEALGHPRSQTRDQAHLVVTAHLQDPLALRETLSAAPAEAVELLERLVAGPPLLRTHCFVPDTGGYYGATSRFHLRPGGSGDPGTDWLAARGLVIPVGPDLAELPYEVGTALRDRDEPLRYAPEPPTPDSARPLPGRVSGEAQAAATAALSRVELLLRATAAQPLAVRKAGGIAVRDTRRLAKAVGAPEQQIRLWLDLAANAGLIAPHRDAPPPARGRKPAPPQPARMLPTERYDTWLAASPADRLVPLIATWAVTPEVFSHWPDEDETPVALVTPQDPHAVPLRYALLAALALLPAGHGVGPAAALSGQALDELVEAAAWQRPAAIEPTGTAEPAAATLIEAELLGVVAHGALTPVGHAVLALLRAGADRYFPAVPGTGIALDEYPALGRAVRDLRAALDALVPAPQTTARFQADLTAIVAGAADPGLADLLGSVADRESDGHAVIWRIGPASVRRALDAGADAADLLDRLAEVSEGGHPLPQALAYLVKDVARTHGRVRVVRSACCLRSDDEALVLELSRTRVLGKLGLRRIAPTVLISSASPADTLAALRSAGYAPVLEAETGTTVVERAPEERAAVEMPSLATARHHYLRGPGTPEELARAVLAGRG